MQTKNLRSLIPSRPWIYSPARPPSDSGHPLLLRPEQPWRGTIPKFFAQGSPLQRDSEPVPLQPHQRGFPMGQFRAELLQHEHSSRPRRLSQSRIGESPGILTQGPAAQGALMPPLPLNRNPQPQWHLQPVSENLLRRRRTRIRRMSRRPKRWRTNQRQNQAPGHCHHPPRKRIFLRLRCATSSTDIQTDWFQMWS